MRIAEERIQEMFEVTAFDPDEVFGFMISEGCRVPRFPLLLFQRDRSQLAETRYYVGEVRVLEA